MKHRGFTLLETLVAASLAMLVTLLITELFIAVSRAGSRVDAEIFLEQTALLSVTRLKQDLSSTSTAGFHWSRNSPPEKVKMYTQPLQAELSEPRALYQQELVYYMWNTETEKLIRSLYHQANLPFPLLPEQPADRGQLTLIGSASPGSSAVMAQHVVAFDVESSVPPPNYSNPLTVHLHLRQTISTEKTADFETRFTYYIPTPSS